MANRLYSEITNSMQQKSLLIYSSS